MGYAYRDSPSPLVSLCWSLEAEGSGSYTDAANEFWGLAFGRTATGRPTATLVGPSVQPRTMQVVEGERAWGVELHAHVFVRGVDKLSILGELRDLPTDGHFFELAGSRFPEPTPEGLEDLIDVLHGQGILVADAVIAAALRGVDPGYSPRQVRRRANAATGLGPKQLDQQRRARRAYALLQSGVPLAQAAIEAGYSDQAHMTRSFVLLAGMTPARILRAEVLDDAFASRPSDDEAR